MKLNEFLTESELTQFYPYGAANTPHDAKFNPEAVKINELQAQRYKELSTGFGGAPVQKEVPADQTVKPYQPEPKSNEIQSPGYRGKQRALKRAGIADNSYQRIDPNELRIQIDDLMAPSRLF